MKKAFELLIGIFLISYKLHYCVAYRSVIGLDYEINALKQMFSFDDQKFEEALASIQDTNKHLRDAVKVVLDSVNTREDLQTRDMELDVNDLIRHMVTVEDIFVKTAKMEKDLSTGKRSVKEAEYLDVSVSGVEKLVDSYIKIGAILQHKGLTHLLGIYFRSSMKRFTYACQTQMSHMQLLDSYLANYKAIQAQYFIARALMYSFLYMHKNTLQHPPANQIEHARGIIENSVKTIYSAFTEHWKKNILSHGYLELWKCDPADGYNVENFAELGKENYYVDLQSVDADSKKVVVGAKLLVQDKTLRIQIQQATLQENGFVDEKSREWKTLSQIDESRRKQISLGDFNFALTHSQISKDEVVTGLSFSASQCDSSVGLAVRSKKFDFRTGVFKGDHTKESLVKCPREEYDMSNREVSTKSRSENQPNSSDGAWVKLSLSNGGQSVIPFIDTQNVEQRDKFVGPLSGASLYIRGQDGYGGFLGIRLLTFNIWDLVVG